MKAGRNIASEKDLERFRQRATELEMENEQLKKNLQQKQEPFYKIFQASSNPMAITTVKEGRIIDLNEAYARFTGYRREELVGQTTIEHGIWTDSKQRDKVVQKLQEEGNVNNLEVGVRTKRGDIRTVLFSVSEISLGNGSYLLSTAIDITDRKNAEEKLRESEEKYRTLVEQSLQGLAIMQNSSFVFCNNRFAEISGYSVEELLSLSFDEITAMINPDDRGFIEDRHRDRMAGRPVSSHYEYQGIKKDGTEFWLEIYSSLIEYNGRPAIQSAFMDITERKQIAEALQQAEEKYRSIYEGALEGMFRSTPNGRFLIVNPALAKMLGFSNSEEVITTIKDIGRQIFAKPERRKEFLNELKKNDMVRGFEFKALRKDGSKIWLSIFAHSVRDSAGRLLYYDGYVEDISERKQAENERRESEERFRLIAETIDEIFWIFDLENNIPTYISPAHERIYGYSRDGSYSMRETFLDPVHPEDRERVVATISQMKNGQVLDYEHRIIRPDGSIRHIWNRCYPIPDETGRIKRYVGIGQDVTAWRHAEAALREKKDYLNEIINCIADPVFVKDRQLRFELVNDAMCAFSGRSRDQMLGLKISQWLPKEQVDIIEQQEESVFESGEECIVEEEVNVTQNDKRTVMVRKALLRNKLGEKQIVSVIRDITEYKRLETQFLQAQKMEAVGVLAGGVAHDFNNLLNVINGYSELVLEDMDQDNPIYSDLEQVKKAGQRAASLTSQLLAFSRKQILCPEDIDLNATISDMSKMLCRLIGEDIELVAIAQPGLGLINADPGQIQQIIMNLAVNARDAMPKGGKLTIELANVSLDKDYIKKHPMAKPGPYIMLAISDNGAGMDSVTQSRLFEPFFTTKEKGKGTGLGLSTVYGIVKQSNGLIWVYSEPGKGTTFKIYFPRVEGEISKQLSERKPELECRAFETVLLAEDEEWVRALASRILRERGYRVLEAINGTEALSIAQEFDGNIQLVLTDVVMPGMGGKDLVSHLEVIRPGIKALYISGYTDDTIVHHGILDSGVAFLQKPFTVENLSRKVREVIDS